MKNIIIFSIFIFLTIIASGQSFKCGEISAISELSESTIETLKPAITVDGKTMFYMVIKQSENKQEISIARLSEAGKWIKTNDSLTGLNYKKYNYFIVGCGQTINSLYVLALSNSRQKESPIIQVYEYNVDKWQISNTISLPEIIIQSNNFDVNISPDENTLLFSVMNEKSIGKEDLFASVKTIDGKWGELINLGKTINTSNSEIAPYLFPDGKTLVFSSNVTGNMDLFISQKIDKSWNNWTKPEPITAINSTLFDAYFTYNIKSKEAFFCSNRTDNVLKIFKIKDFIVKNTDNNSTNCAEYDLKIKKIESNIISQQAQLDSLKNIIKNLSFLSNQSSENNNTVADKKNNIVNAEKLYFDFNSALLRPEAKEELLKLAEYMKANKNIKINIVGYADAVGTKEANIKLSTTRAKNARLFLNENGIEKSRMNFKGEGFANQVFPNAKTQEEYSRNRRVEIEIVEK